MFRTNNKIAPLSDCTSSAMSRSNAQRPRKQQQQSIVQQPDKFSHNPYAEVLPGTVDEMLRVLEYRKMQSIRRMQQQAMSAPQSPVMAMPPRCNSAPVMFFEEPEVLTANNSTTTASTTTPQKASMDSSVESVRSNLSSPNTSGVLTKVYKNGRPVPRVREETVVPDENVIIADPTAYVRVKFPRHEAVFKVSNMTLRIGNYVLVDGDRGHDVGAITAAETSSESVEKEVQGNVQRAATDAEVDALKLLREEEAKVLDYTQQQAARHLQQKLTIVSVSFQADREKLTVWYKSPERVYFVPLLKALNQQYKCRIWMERLEE